MTRVFLLASLLAAGSLPAFGQTLSVLHIKVAVIDAERKITPVPRHALLISEEPPSAPPRRIVTAADGTVNVRLRPGNYTVESDQPVTFEGRVYQWTKRVAIAAGRDEMLELTADNAAVESAAPGTKVETDPSFLLPQWQASVVAVWTPTTHASGFIVDARGLIATSERVIGTATTVEVQLGPEVKVAGRVLATDQMRDVAVLWIDPKVVASVRPLSLGCGQAARPSVARGQELFTIGVPLRGQKGIVYGGVSRIEPRAILTDFRLPPGSAGGPVFAAAGGLVGITTVVTGNDDGLLPPSRVVRIDEACEVVAAAEKKMADLAPPAGTPLPVEPARPFPGDALKDLAQRRAGSLSPPQVAATDFDVAFVTPVLTYGAQYQSGQAGRPRGSGPITVSGGSPGLRALRDFSNWSEYVDEFPPVLLIRATPKMVESFWTTVARGAAMTQGMAVPAIKHFKAGFLRMQAYCGDAEVTPIHPFKLEQRVAETEAVYEGLYVFDPGALGPHCGTVRLVLYSEKEPEKADTRVVDAKVLERIWQDFAPYREQAAAR